MKPQRMADLVETILEDDRWHAANLEALAETTAQAMLAHMGIDPSGFEISLMGCSDTRIAELNGQFRGKPAPTNVLSWPSEDRYVEGQHPKTPEPDELGDIAISFDTCEREAKAAGKPFEDHVRHLFVHGVLHLLGYDHETDADAHLMEGLETSILATLGIKDPYLISDG